MSKQPRSRLLAVALVLAVGLLGLHAALHWHGPSYDNCQACHTGRVALSAPFVLPAVETPETIARFAPPETPPVSLEPFSTSRTPRAPPV
ncbi:MAG TPA: hypothetical protein VEJ45_07705 [Candidatus Acidoferrales bacterium]|nr:hypothetical protein [Candidatus Acidoferrales bacterium]